MTTQNHLLTQMKVWDGKKMFCHGDIVFYNVDEFEGELTKDKPRKVREDGRLVLEEGEATGHFHALWMPQACYAAPAELASSLGVPPAFAATLGTPNEEYVEPEIGVATFFETTNVAEILVKHGITNTTDLQLGLLTVEDGNMLLTHDEHAPVSIPPGNYYVGAQQEMDAGHMRRVAD